MKIVRIFADQLFAFQYEGEVDNEYDRLMELWTDVTYLKAFAQNNGIKNSMGFVNNILNDAEQIQDFLEDLNQNKDPYGFYFEPLQLSEFNKLPSLQKGKIRENQLRYYAIKLDENCFVITGGAIKMSQKMQDHPDTNNELIKLKKAKEFFISNEVIDTDSFFELLIEQQ
ncbi:MAG: hypothetical protein KDC52_14160 [Ignavibacteriae bacterium]|nr:hypothetical protein [Saprospiraceae bacterium]MCB0752611.1 hypothetical protein [Ignavibacteriota bacterium]